MWHGDWTGTDWVLMGLGMLVFWGLVAAVVLWLVASARRDAVPPPQPPKSEPAPTGLQARNILDDRLARGEISAEEHQQRRALLPPR